jgi:hypothetical protein
MQNLTRLYYNIQYYNVSEVSEVEENIVSVVVYHRLTNAYYVIGKVGT